MVISYQSYHRAISFKLQINLESFIYFIFSLKIDMMELSKFQFKILKKSHYVKLKQTSLKYLKSSTTNKIKINLFLVINLYIYIM